ncbi:MAG TPA: hypothetical protein VHS78_18165 [Candidatus Elarobacter sp.]|jgi:hypothetical protein|nr:hypothetical protein [Candidatus Elarobacter sp.]
MSDRKRKGRILTTAAEMKRAARAALEREATATKILHVRYERRRDALSVDLSTGVSLVVPRVLIPGFAKAPPSAVADVAIDPGSESLWSDTVDDGVLLEQLVEIAAGDELLQVLGGRIAGRRRSVAKANAARANGAKGGRPPLEITAFLDHLERTLHTLVPDAPRMTVAEDRDGTSSARWQDGSGILLELEPWRRNEVAVVSAAWPTKRSHLRRVRASAELLARNFSRWLEARRQREAQTRAVERIASTHRVRKRKKDSGGRRSSAARSV